MAGKAWRDKIRPIVAEEIERLRGQPVALIRKALRSSPKRPHGGWLLKVWLSEIRSQLKLPGKRHSKKPDNQRELF